MFFELVGSSYELNEILYTVGLFALASFLAVWVHAVGHRIMQAICMGKEFDRALKESVNPLKAFSLKNIFSVAVMFFFSFTRLEEAKAPCLSKFKNMLISVSGAATNFIWAIAALVGYDVLLIMEWNEELPEYGILLRSFLLAFLSVNLAIAIFNMFPLPSLDGGVFIAQFMPEKAAETFLSWKRYAVFFITVAILFLSRSGLADAMIGGVTGFFDNIIFDVAENHFGVDFIVNMYQ